MFVEECQLKRSNAVVMLLTGKLTTRSYWLFICFSSDLTLKEDANKKAFEQFAKESYGGVAVEVAEVSERYESTYRCILF